MDEMLYPIPNLTGYSISHSGLVFKDKNLVKVHPNTRNNGFKSGFVGTKYQFSAYGELHTKFEIIKQMFGDDAAKKFRECDYFKPKIKTIREEKIEGKYAKDKRIKLEYRNPLLIWYEVSGKTSNYQNYFDSRNTSVDKIVYDINEHILCETQNCVEVLDYEWLKISWSEGVETEDWLSFNLLLYFHQRITTGSGYFAAKMKLSPEEYLIFGYVSKNIFHINLETDYGESEEEVSDEIMEFKNGKSEHQVADHTIGKIKESDNDFEEYKLDYEKFNTYQNSDCSRFVFDNLIYYRKKDISDSARITTKNFNLEFRHLIQMNNNQFTLSEIFTEWCPYYFQLENGIRRLETDLVKKLLKEIGY